MFLLLMLICFGVLTIWWFMKPQYPSPPTFPGALPLIGHGVTIMVHPLELWRKEKEIYRFCIESCGGVIKLMFGPHPVYVLTDLDDCYTVANTCIDKPYLYGFAKVLYNRGLATSDAITWTPHRKLLNPAFNLQILNTFVEEFGLQGRRLVSELSHEVGKEQFDVTPYLVETMIQTAFNTTIGVDKTNNSQQEMILTYADLTDKFFTLLSDRFRAIWLHLPFIFNLSSLKKEQSEVVKELNNITETIITKRKSEQKHNIYENSMHEIKSGYKTLLEQLLKQESFSDEEIREHLDTIIGGAYDTTTRTLTFCLILVGSYPDVQTRLFKEVQEVFDEPDRDLTKQDLPKLVYLEAVLKETLRLYPPFPRVSRYIQSDVKLKNYTIPSGSTILMSLYGINRHPMWWGSDADEFKPERWLDSTTLPENSNAFAAFSLGKRNCIGKQYAMMAMKTILANIIRRYHVTGNIRKVQCTCDVILRPVAGHQISLKLRN